MGVEVASLVRAERLDSRWAASRSRRHALVRGLILRTPRLGLCCAHALAHLLHRAGRIGPTPGELAELHPRLGQPALAHLARGIAARSFKSECIDRLKHRRGASRRLHRSLLDPERARILSGIRGPTVVATFHSGPLLAVRWALERADLPTLVLAYGRSVEMDAGQQRIDTEGAPANTRAGAIVQAVSFLRSHESSVVLMAPDGGTGERAIRVELMGSRMWFRPGAAAIARLAGARLLPVMARWETTTRIGIRAGAALPGVESGADEAEATRGLARFAEAHFEKYPGDLSTLYVSRLAAADPTNVPSAHNRRSSS